MIPSGIGFVLFVYGKKQDRGIYMLGGRRVHDLSVLHAEQPRDDGDRGGTWDGAMAGGSRGMVTMTTIRSMTMALAAAAAVVVSAQAPDADLILINGKAFTADSGRAVGRSDRDP